MRGVLARVTWLLAAAVLWASVAGGHDLSHSESDITVREREVRARLRVDLVGFGGLQWRTVDRIAYEELDRQIDVVFSLIKAHLEIASLESQPASIRLAAYSLVDNHVLDAEIVYRFAAAPSTLTVRSRLDRITAADHQHLARVNFGGAADAAVLTAGAAAASFSGTSRWRGRVFSIVAGARAAATRPSAVLVACLLGFGTASRRALRGIGLALAAGAAAGLALSTAGATAFAGSLARLGDAMIGVLAIVTLLDGRGGDRSVVSAIFMLTWTLGVSAAQRAQGLDDALSLAGFGGGAVAAVVALASMIRALAGRLTLAARVRRAIASVAMAASLYWLLQPWIRG
jgi:hypothetical protein